MGYQLAAIGNLQADIYPRPCLVLEVSQQLPQLQRSNWTFCVDTFANGFDFARTGFGHCDANDADSVYDALCRRGESKAPVDNHTAGSCGKSAAVAPDGPLSTNKNKQCAAAKQMDSGKSGAILNLWQDFGR